MSVKQQDNATLFDEKGERGSTSSMSKEEAGVVVDAIDTTAERAYGTFYSLVHSPSELPLTSQIVRKLDLYLLPFLSIMYFFNSVDRSNLGNAKTDGMDKDLGFTGEQYSLLILLFYIPNGLCDLPLNMLTKKWSGRVMLPTCKLHVWTAQALRS